MEHLLTRQGFALHTEKGKVDGMLHCVFGLESAPPLQASASRLAGKGGVNRLSGPPRKRETI